MRLDWKNIAALLFALWAASAGARELYGPEYGVVPYGMGRAYSAIADDWLALHYNPAGLAEVHGAEMQLADVQLGLNADTVKGYSSYKDLGSSGNTAQKLQKLSGKEIDAKISDATQLTIPHFAMAMVYDYAVNFDNQNLVYPAMHIRDTQDFGFIAGTGFGVGKASNRQDALRFGMAVKYLRRTGTIEDITVAQIGTNQQALLDNFQQSGWGIGTDFGMQYQLPIDGRVEYTVSWVVHDLGDTSFNLANQNNAPAPIQENMVAGLGIRFPIGGKVNRRQARRFGQPRSVNHLSFAADYSQMNLSPDKEQLAKHMHFGMNLDLPVFSLQAGVNQTSFTYGFSMDFEALRISAASYAEELGSYAGQRPDRRYLLSIGSGFGFSKF